MSSVEPVMEISVDMFLAEQGIEAKEECHLS